METWHVMKEHQDNEASIYKGDNCILQAEE